MLPWSLIALSLSILPYSAPTHAQVPPGCHLGEYEYPEKACEEPLNDITVVTPGEFLIAKLQSYGCPVVGWAGENHRSGRYVSYVDNTAMLFNISLSPNRKQLLLNDVPLVPLNSPPPPRIYAGLVPLDWSFADLSDSYWCMKQPCLNLDGRCYCVENTVGGIGLSYDYTSPSMPWIAESTKSVAWEITFDVIGGQDGYKDDPNVVLDDARQKMLVIKVEQNVEDGSISILGAELREREPQPPLQKQWILERVLFFLGLRKHPSERPGHVVYIFGEWTYDGTRVGTLSYYIRGTWDALPLLLIAVIVGPTILGLMVLYFIYRIVRAAYSLPPTKIERMVLGEGQSKGWDERERLLDEDEDEEGDFLARPSAEGQGRAQDKPLPDKPLPPLPEEDAF